MQSGAFWPGLRTMSGSINSTRKRDIFDFAVVGDGPVGLSGALALRQLGSSVVLIAAKPPAEVSSSITPLDLRVYALAPDVLKFQIGRAHV